MFDFCLKHLLEILTAIAAGTAVVIRSLNITSGLHRLDEETRENGKTLQELKQEIAKLSIQLELTRSENKKHTK